MEYPVRDVAAFRSPPMILRRPSDLLGSVQTVCVSSNPSCRIAGLSPGSSYTCQVLAVTAWGYWEPTTMTFLTQQAPPERISIINIHQATARRLDLQKRVNTHIQAERDAPAYEIHPHNVPHDKCVAVTGRCIPYHLEQVGVRSLPTETNRIHKSQMPALFGCLEIVRHLKDLQIGRTSSGGKYLEAHMAGLATACDEVPDLAHCQG